MFVSPDHQEYCLTVVAILGNQIHSLKSAVILEAVLKDPVLSARGGLRRFSEMGRTLPETMFAEDDDDLQGDSDDNDFVVQHLNTDGSDDEDGYMNMAHGNGWQMGANGLVNVPANQLLDFIMGGLEEGEEEYPVMHD